MRVVDLIENSPLCSASGKFWGSLTPMRLCGKLCRVWHAAGTQKIFTDCSLEPEGCRGSKWQPCPASFYTLTIWAVYSLEGDYDPRVQGEWLRSCCLSGKHHCAHSSNHGSASKPRVRTFWKDGDSKCNKEQCEHFLPFPYPITPYTWTSRTVCSITMELQTDAKTCWFRWVAFYTNSTLPSCVIQPGVRLPQILLLSSPVTVMVCSLLFCPFFDPIFQLFTPSSHPRFLFLPVSGLWLVFQRLGLLSFFKLQFYMNTFQFI